MNNKVLIFFSCFLTLLLIISAFNNSKSNRYEYVSTDNELFINNIQCIPDITRSYEKVKEIFGKKNILFFRFVNTSCSSCTDSHLDEILIFQEEIGKDNLWIFPAYPKDRKSRVKLSVDLEKFNYLNIPRDSLLVPKIEDEDKSYFAWINNKGEIDLVFLPDLDKPQQTRRYFQEVKKLINEAKQQ